MVHLGTLEPGSRHDLHVAVSPDAPDEDKLGNEARAPSAMLIPTKRRLATTGRALRVVLFVSGCLLRCYYCHNPDTWHLKDGTYISARQVLDRLAGFAPALRALRGG